jgi:transcriptional regulator GlxA family with amidase domain
MKLGIPVYQGVDLLDVAGPYEMFNWVDKEKGLEVVVVSAEGYDVTSRDGLRIGAHASFAETPVLDVLWVPGGDPDVLGIIMSDPHSPYLTYLRQVAEGARWVCSVCEGALLLARAGLLDGHKVTTHWYFEKCLSRFPVEVVPGHPRFVVSGNRVTGGGISSGLDEALKLIELLFDQDTAKSVQETTQYFPDPPVHGTMGLPPDCPVKWCVATKGYSSSETPAG